MKVNKVEYNKECLFFLLSLKYWFTVKNQFNPKVMLFVGDGIASSLVKATSMYSLGKLENGNV